MEINFKLLFVKDFIFVSFNKIGSRYLHSIVNQTKFNAVSCSFNVDENFKIINKIEIYNSNIKKEQSILQKYIYREWYKITNNTCDKHLVIFYRNPLERLYSGLVEEISSLIIDLKTDSNYLDKISKKLFNSSDEQLKFKSNISNNIFLPDSKTGITESQEERYKKVVTYFFIENLNRIINLPHTSHIYPYLYIFATRFKFNKKLINIDNQSEIIESILKENNIINSNTYKSESNNKLKRYIIEVIRNNKINYLLPKINDFLTIETFFYNQLDLLNE